MDSDKEAGSITLPEQVFRNLKKAKRFAIDIGGSLTKIAYYSTVSYKRALYSLDEEGDSQNPDETHYEVIETDVESARLHFIKFETKHIESCLRFIQKNLIGSPDFMRGKSIKATGGGAYKYTDVLTKTLGLIYKPINRDLLPYVLPAVSTDLSAILTIVNHLKRTDLVCGKSFIKKADTTGQFAEVDIARSLLFMISNDIGQIACLYAMMHNLGKVYFGGSFLRAHYLSMHTISFAINYWSKGKVQALFLRHEGYLAAIGAFLTGAEEYDTDKYSWCENYAGSSGLSSPLPAQPISGNPMIDQLEMDCADWRLVHCPLLKEPAEYVPDTIDLTLDADAREYWLVCFENAIDKFVERAIQSQIHHSDAHQRAKIFKEKYLSRLQHLRSHPFAYGSLTVRSLLDMREHCLTEFDFPDPYLQQKRLENELALKMLKSRLDSLNTLPWEEKQIAVVEGLLAGNMFDWGAKEVAKIMETSDFGFTEAKMKLQARPWLVDNLNEWLERLKGTAHKCAAIFVDNSGMDVVLGVLPFALELLKRKTKVLLCANSKPALNDVTYQELKVLVRKASDFVSEIKDALSSCQLKILDSGQGSPCLDLSRLNLEVAQAMESNGTDLIILEGMGRALHTNLNAEFKCESIKAAVLKNLWLSNRLGGDMFSVIFKYENPLIST
ncbi:4'-phosphopantetheine phosphatase [Trichonephila inaurata madagascariensis]|uniref:4'-phosphopantetheine phosphatase n=1 Tax=Trichonephila inaurata madagascariensis TaxID=2747483 RepID=A0A8X6Y4M7_9ARAC|nr:4'-phosphopantetheine phosphatase [Trichonephila inaurata madagascariensis]